MYNVLEKRYSWNWAQISAYSITNRYPNFNSISIGIFRVLSEKGDEVELYTSLECKVNMQKG